MFTKLYENYEQFKNDTTDYNGCTQEFLDINKITFKKFKKMNKSNIGCWNCIKSKKMIFCDYCSKCENCIKCNHLVKCKCLTNCTHCINCEIVENYENSIGVRFN